LRMRRPLEQWLAAGISAGLGLAVAVVAFRGGLEPSALFTVALLAALTVWAWPKRGAGTSHRTAIQRHDSQGDAVVYWRPGCLYCSLLRTRLGRVRSRPVWVNIWADDDAAQFVRSANGGNEVVPTVLLDGVAYTNPDPAEIRVALEERAGGPH